MRLTGYAMNDHLTRYRLPNGWFMDRDSPHMNYGKRYTVWEPGASESGSAADPAPGYLTARRAVAENIE